MNEAQKEVIANEKNVKTAEQFRKLVRGLAQNAELTGELKVMRSQKEHLEKELEMIASSGGIASSNVGGGVDSKTMMETNRALKQLQSIQETLMNQMQDIKQGQASMQSGGGYSGGGGGADGAEAKLRAEFHIYGQKWRPARVGCRFKDRAQTPKSGGGGGGGGGDEASEGD